MSNITTAKHFLKKRWKQIYKEVMQTEVGTQTSFE